MPKIPRRSSIVMHDAGVFLWEIDPSFNLHAQGREFRDKRNNFPRELTLQRAHGGPSGCLGAGFDQVGDTLGLRQVQLAIEKSAFAEFPWLCQACTQCEAPAQQNLQHSRTPVTLQLKDVFSRVGPGAREEQRNPCIQSPAAGI